MNNLVWLRWLQLDGLHLIDMSEYAAKGCGISGREDLAARWTGQRVEVGRCNSATNVNRIQNDLVRSKFLANFCRAHAPQIGASSVRQQDQVNFRFFC